MTPPDALALSFDDPEAMPKPPPSSPALALATTEPDPAPRLPRWRWAVLGAASSVVGGVAGLAPSPTVLLVGFAFGLAFAGVSRLLMSPARPPELVPVAFALPRRTFTREEVEGSRLDLLGDAVMRHAAELRLHEARAECLREEVADLRRALAGPELASLVDMSGRPS